MTYIPKYKYDAIKSLTAFDYLSNYHPDMLIRNGRTDFIYRDHDSLHFSNGKWYWWSRKIGGTSALSFMQLVEGYTEDAAKEELLNLMHIDMPVNNYLPRDQKAFVLPIKDDNNDKVIDYLCNKRKLDKHLINYLIEHNYIYQDKYHKNAVFVGYDNNNKPAYAFKRSIDNNLKFDHLGSNKAFSFSFTNPNNSELHVFEAAIDLLSYMTMLKMANVPVFKTNYLSLAGASINISGKREADIPIALEAYLKRNKHIKKIIFHLDNDEVGLSATQKMISLLSDEYDCEDKHPTEYKDINEELIHIGDNL